MDACCWLLVVGWWLLVVSGLVVGCYVVCVCCSLFVRVVGCSVGWLVGFSLLVWVVLFVVIVFIVVDVVAVTVVDCWCFVVGCWLVGWLFECFWLFVVGCWL